MNLMLITIESINPKRYDNLGNQLKEFGDDCQLFELTWALHTHREPAEIFKHLQYGLVDPRDKFIVAPLSGPWIPFNCKSADDCEIYDYSY